MTRHIDFLGVLYLICGGLAALLGAAMFALAAGAAMIMTTGDEGAQIAAGLTAATFGVIGAIALAWGAGNAVTGRALRHRRPWSRVGALTLGVVNLLILPFGTALGVYTFWVLLHEDAK